jgi:ferredoxin
VGVRLVADGDRCVGAGHCVLSDPETFDQGDVGGTVVLLRQPPDGDALARAREAVYLCPSRALALVDEPPTASLAP